MVSQADIPPGGEGKVEVKVSTTGRAGPLSKSVNVATDDPVEPNLSLTVNANLVVELELEAATLQLPPLQVGREHIQEVRVLARDSKLLAFGAVTSDLEGVTGTMVQHGTADAPAWVLQLRAKPTTVRTAWGHVNVVVKAPKPRHLALPVHLAVTGDAGPAAPPLLKQPGKLLRKP